MSNYSNGLVGAQQGLPKNYSVTEYARHIEEQVRSANAERQRANDAQEAFLRLIAEALRPVIREELEAMATKIGRATVKDGKVKPSKGPPHFAVAKAKKAARVVKRLKANREAKR